MKHARNRMATVNLPFLVLLMGALATPAAAQDPEVTSADPSAAEQATVDLEVTVGGDNFGPDSDVEFLVTGTEDPGGIHVKNVKRKGPKTLKVTIDVAEQAVTDLFDIRVTSNGRKGRGTELFRVVKPGELPNESGEAQDVIVELGDTTLCGEPGDPILGDSLKEDGQGPYHPSSHDRIYVGGDTTVLELDPDGTRRRTLEVAGPPGCLAVASDGRVCPAEPAGPHHGTGRQGQEPAPTVRERPLLRDPRRRRDGRDRSMQPGGRGLPCSARALHVPEAVQAQLPGASAKRRLPGRLHHG